MRIACWIHKATGTHPEYVILIDFPLQQWLQEHASMLRYMHIDCLVVKWNLKDINFITIYLRPLKLTLLDKCIKCMSKFYPILRCVIPVVRLNYMLR